MPINCCIMLCVQFVPLIVEVCTQIIEEKGIDNRGIYRVSGNSGAVTQLQEELNKVSYYLMVLIVPLAWAWVYLGGDGISKILPSAVIWNI